MKPMKSTARYLQRRSFRLKILAGFLLVSLIPLVLMSTVSYRLSNRVIYRNTHVHTEVIIDRVRDELNTLFSESLSFAESVASNSTVLEALEGNFQPEDIQSQLRVKAGEELLKIFGYREDIFSISIIGENGFRLHSRNDKVLKEDPRKKYWYRSVLQSPFPPVVYPPHPGSFVYDLEEMNFFSFAFPIESPVSTARLGVVLIDLREESLKEILTARLGETGYLFLQYNRFGFTSSSDQVPDSEYLIRLANNEAIPDELLDKNREMVLIRDLGIPDIKLASVVSLVELTRDSRMIGSVLAVLVIISLGLSVFLASLLSAGIAHPVQDLRSLMLSVEKGDLTVRMKDLPSDDLGDLGRSFNQMVQRIQNLLEEIKEDQVKLRKAELRTLQAQINPHFLYNTLDSINWLSREERSSDVVKMVYGLKNVHDRLQIYYGDPYGLMIHSLEGEGTTVTIKFPGEFKTDAKNTAG